MAEALVSLSPHFVTAFFLQCETLMVGSHTTGDRRAEVVFPTVSR